MPTAALKGRRSLSGLVLAAMLAAGAGIARAEGSPCPSPLAARTVVELFFGRNVGETVGVSEEEWARFVDAEVTPRFPDGITVLDLAGQWRDRASGRIVREPGKLLLIVLDDGPAPAARIGEIVDRYKRQFQQQSVLMVQRQACVAF